MQIEIDKEVFQISEYDIIYVSLQNHPQYHPGVVYTMNQVLKVFDNVDHARKYRDRIVKMVEEKLGTHRVPFIFGG